MDGIIGFIEEHPAAIGLAVIAVALLAFYQSKSAPGVSYTANNGPTLDPAAAAVQEANIAAGSQNVGLLAALIGGARSTDAQLALGLHTSDNELAHANADTSANLTAQLHATDVAQEVADRRATYDQTVSLAGIAGQTIAAQYTAQSQQDATRANLEAERARIQQEQNIARAADNTSIANTVIGGLFHLGGQLLSFLAF